MTDQQRLLRHPLLFYIQAHFRSFSGGVIFLIITNIIDASTPLIIKLAIDQLTQKAAWNDFVLTILVLLGLHFVLGGTRYAWRTFFTRFHTFGSEDLRARIFKNYTDLGPNFYNRNSTGELMSLISNDVNSVRNAIGSGLLMFLDSLILCCIILPAMFYLNGDWAWKVLIVMPFMPFMFWKVMQLINRAYRSQQEALSELSGFAQEIVSGMRVIKSYAQEKNFLNQYKQFNSRNYQASNKLAKVDGLFTPTWQFAVASGTVILLFVGADDVISGAATLGTFVAFQRYIAKLVWPMSALGMSLSSFQKGRASFDRIKENLTTQTDIPDEGQRVLEKFSKLSVKNLNFTYAQSQPILKNINFEIHKGETVGIVGPVGSGKSTLLNVINRLYPVPANTVCINEQSIEEYTQKSLHQKLVFVPQEPFLFSETIAENLSLGLGEVSPQQVLGQAAHTVDIIDEVTNLEHGFNSQLGEKGINLSGGQKQRLTIARGLLTRGEVLFLDDSLSAVDIHTEQKIEKQLQEQNLTKVIATHRLTSIVNADKIIVLNNGEIEAIGQHQELMRNSPTYREMALLQGYTI